LLGVWAKILLVLNWGLWLLPVLIRASKHGSRDAELASGVRLVVADLYHGWETWILQMLLLLRWRGSPSCILLLRRVLPLVLLLVVRPLRVLDWKLLLLLAILN